jgi:hypothetical protein
VLIQTAFSVLYLARLSSTDARFASLKRLGILSNFDLSSALESFLAWDGNIRSQTQRKMILLFEETKQTSELTYRSLLPFYYSSCCLVDLLLIWGGWSNSATTYRPFLRSTLIREKRTL